MDVFPIMKLCLESVWIFLVFDIVTVTESNHLVRGSITTKIIVVPTLPPFYKVIVDY